LQLNQRVQVQTKKHKQEKGTEEVEVDSRATATDADLKGGK
jgi:hypothetical protein